MVITLIVALFKSSVLDVYVVHGVSMEPSYNDGQYILVLKFSYNIRTPEHLPFTGISIPSIRFEGLDRVKKGEVVVFHLPQFIGGRKRDNAAVIVKRIVGLPGDTIEIHFTDKKINCINKDILILRVPQKNDSIHLISSYNQFISDLIFNEGHTVKRIGEGSFLIDGKPAKCYVVKHDYYFLMGDNRNFSSDSRKWGFLPRSNLIGKVE